ncbi:MAG: hypothetical protein QXU28_07155 [Nitrososphaerota archaeon]
MGVIMDALTIGITLYDLQNIIKEAREKIPQHYHYTRIRRIWRKKL